MERIRGSFRLNGWPQNQSMTVFTPSRVMCKSVFLFEGKAFLYPSDANMEKYNFIFRGFSVYHRVMIRRKFGEHERSVEFARRTACHYKHYKTS